MMSGFKWWFHEWLQLNCLDKRSKSAAVAHLEQKREIDLWLVPTARQTAPNKLSGAFLALADKTPELTLDRALISEVFVALLVI